MGLDTPAVYACFLRGHLGSVAHSISPTNQPTNPGPPTSPAFPDASLKVGSSKDCERIRKGGSDQERCSEGGELGTLDLPLESGLVHNRSAQLIYRSLFMHRPDLILSTGSRNQKLLVEFWFYTAKPLN